MYVAIITLLTKSKHEVTIVKLKMQLIKRKVPLPVMIILDIWIHKSWDTI